ncbi:endonuclease G [Belnapia rosea]|nr:endonuclease G [Belnapia rosea]
MGKVVYCDALREHLRDGRGFASPHAIWLAVGILSSTPAGAAPTSCPQHFAAGSAPAIVRSSLSARVRELCFEAFAVLHSGVSRTPIAVAEHLTRAGMEGAREVRREGTFHDEDRLPADERARLSDYARSGFDRGHMAPSGDMPTPSSMNESFSLANMVPQHPASNRCLWEGVETSVRRLAVEQGEIYVVTGPVFQGASLERIGERVLVPTALYKAVYVPRRGAAAAYLAPNGPGMAWRAVSLSELRELVGIDVLPDIPAAARERPLPLPEPRPNNVRGGCEGSAQVAGSNPGGLSGDHRAGPAPSRPAPHPAQTQAKPSSGWSTTTIVVYGLLALIMAVVLFRVLGRR